MTVFFNNNGVFACRFSVQWDGGESSQTGMVTAGGSDQIDMTPYTSQVPAGGTCFARLYVLGGVNHDSGAGFTLDAGNVTYTATGGSMNPSFDCNGCNK